MYSKIYVLFEELKQPDHEARLLEVPHCPLFYVVLSII